MHGRVLLTYPTIEIESKYENNKLYGNKSNLRKDGIAQIKLGKEILKLNKGNIIYNKKHVTNDKR